jgi:hypothetical protein
VMSRFVITRAVDFSSAEQYPNQLVALSAARGVMTNCAYILAPSTSQDTSGDKAYSVKVNYSLLLSVYQLIYSVCDIARVRRISMGRDGHRLSLQ